MTFEQKGAYMELLLLNFSCFSDGLPGFTEQEALDALARATAYAALWNFLKPKFQTDGQFFWSERMHKEFQKSKTYSEKQSERANKRWNNPTADATAYACNRTGNGNGTEDGKDKGGMGGKDVDPEIILQNVTRETDPLPGELVWRDELYRESLFRLARSYSIPDVENLLDRWEGWYVNKFDWRKKDLQEMRLSFESWIKDPKSRQNGKPTFNKNDRAEFNQNELAIIAAHASGGSSA